MNSSPFSLMRIGTLPFVAITQGTVIPRVWVRAASRHSALDNEHDLLLLAQIANVKTVASLELYDAHLDEVFRHAFGEQ